VVVTVVEVLGSHRSTADWLRTGRSLVVEDPAVIRRPVPEPAALAAPVPRTAPVVEGRSGSGRFVPGAVLRRRRLAPLALLGVTVLAAAGFIHVADSRFGIYGVSVLSLLSVKVLLSLLPGPKWRGDPATRVCAVVPFMNEDPAILTEVLDALAGQDRPLGQVVVVDDGSVDLAGRAVARSWCAQDPERRTLVVFGVNRGKRHALVVAAALGCDSDVLMCIDSDTVLEPTAVRHATAPFTDPTVQAGTGLLVARNWRANLLTRMLDVRYLNAFACERQAYSNLGSVLCVSGAIAAYRTELVLDHREAFLTQSFLGRPSTFGEDRRLTNYALVRGRVVFTPRAVGHTCVPERLGHFVRQQTRWGKSFFRESLWVLLNRPPRALAWWLTLLELTTWAGYTVSLVASVALAPLHLWHYLGWMALSSWARSVHALNLDRPDTRFTDRLVTLAVAPLYGVMAMLVLLPLRVWSLVTLRRGGWGAREQVEVTLDLRDPVRPVATSGRVA
jgi:hyaluronan synthase